MGAFEEVELPAGKKMIGLKWVYDHKIDSEGKNIVGKEKARLVAQGFNQRPGQYDETYAPVAKMTSVRLLLAWVAVRDLKIYQFDCKTAFCMLRFVTHSMLDPSLAIPLLLLQNFSVFWWHSMVFDSPLMNSICSFLPFFLHLE